MPSDKLREILEGLNLDVLFFFKFGRTYDVRDLLALPPKYLKRIEAFISTHSEEELNGLELKDFIEQSTGENYDKVIKMMNIAKKIQSIDQDFN